MKKELKTLIDKIDTSKATTSYVNIDDFMEEFDLSFYSVNWKIEDPWNVFEEKVKAIPIYTWICTDTRVGIFAYTFEEKLICLSFQTGRKMDKEFYWVSKEAALSIRKFIESMIEPRDKIWLLDDFNDSYWEIESILAEMNNDKL